MTFEFNPKFQYDSYHISSEVIADSYNPYSKSRITTLKIRLPRIILAEFNTHRKFSRNFSSSRAIPAKKLRQEVWNHPFIPVCFGINKRGMSAEEYATGFKLKWVKFVWKAASKLAVLSHWILDKCHIHKQICNRLLEPWLCATGIVTSTEWNNFLKLRLSSSAQPEIQCLAYEIKKSLENSQPKTLSLGEAHLPYIDNEDKSGSTLLLGELVAISVARCCRVSYNNMLGKKSQPTEDINLFYRLIKNKHLSPLEHIAFVQHKPNKLRSESNMSRNFDGWYQLRAYVEDNKWGWLEDHYNCLLRH